MISENPQNDPPSRNWRTPLTLGLAVGLALPTAQGVERNLQPSLGSLGALAVSIVAAGVVAGLASLVASWLVKPGGDARA